MPATSAAAPIGSGFSDSSRLKASRRCVNRGGAVGAFSRVVEVAGGARRVGRDRPPGKLQPTENDGEHIIEIMSDTAGQLAYRLHLLDLP